MSYACFGYHLVFPRGRAVGLCLFRTCVCISSVCTFPEPESLAKLVAAKLPTCVTMLVSVPLCSKIRLNSGAVHLIRSPSSVLRTCTHPASKQPCVHTCRTQHHAQPTTAQNKARSINPEDPRCSLVQVIDGYLEPNSLGHTISDSAPRLCREVRPAQPSKPDIIDVVCSHSDPSTNAMRAPKHCVAPVVFDFNSIGLCLRQSAWLRRAPSTARRPPGWSVPAWVVPVVVSQR